MIYACFTATLNINPNVLCVALEVRQGGTSCCCIVHCVGTSSESLPWVGSDLVVNSNVLMTSLSLTQAVSQHTHVGPHGNSLIDSNQYS